MQNGVFVPENPVESEEHLPARSYDRVFISHAYQDRNVVQAFVELLEDIGLGPDEIFYSSLAEYGVAHGENIADAIKREFMDKKIYVVFMLSENYYQSAMCLNEMGAAWVLQRAYSSVLLPGFEYRSIKGAIDAGRIGMKLDGDEMELKSRLIEFRNLIQEGLGLKKLDERIWNRKVEDFLKKIGCIGKT